MHRIRRNQRRLPKGWVGSEGAIGVSTPKLFCTILISCITLAAHAWGQLNHLDSEWGQATLSYAAGVGDGCLECVSTCI